MLTCAFSKTKITNMKLRILLFCLSFILLIGCSKHPLQYPKNLPEVVKEIERDFDENITMKVYYFDTTANTYRAVFYNKEGKHVVSDIIGAAEIIALKNDKGEYTLTNYDENQKPMMNKAMGYAQQKIVYNERGLATQESYYNEKGELINKVGFNFAEFAEARFEYDANGNVVKESYYNALQKIILPVILREYDSDSHLLRIKYVDESGKLMLNDSKYAEERYEYDNQGRLIQQSYHDVYGELATRGEEGHVAMTKIRYEGKSEVRQFFDVYGELYTVDVDFVDEEIDRKIDAQTFGDATRVKNILDFFACKLELYDAESPYKVLASWAFWSDNTYSTDNLKALYTDKWEKSITDFKNAGWDYYETVKYLSGNSERLLAVFDQVKGYLTAVVPPYTYYKLEINKLVDLLLDAYADIYSNDPDMVLSQIRKEMKKRGDEIVMSEMYDYIAKNINLSLSDLNIHNFQYSGKTAELKAIMAWAYSFWARRDSEGTTNVAHSILSAIKTVYDNNYVEIEYETEEESEE